jgi:hypothetical protein
MNDERQAAAQPTAIFRGRLRSIAIADGLTRWSGLAQCRRSGCSMLHGSIVKNGTSVKHDGVPIVRPQVAQRVPESVHKTAATRG